MKLSDDLRKWRAERPDEWTMDRFIKAAEILEKKERAMTHVYNSGYEAGHHDTVEGTFTNIVTQDMDTYQGDVVEELIEEIIRC